MKPHKNKNHEKSAVVACLSLAAMALPGLMPNAEAGRIEDTFNTDFQYGRYVESDGRMAVDTFDLAGSAPIGKAITATLGLVRDTMSGASPVYNIMEGGEIVQVLSGASRNADISDCGKSICDQRDAMTGGLSYFFDNSVLAVGGGFSQERDYTSRFFNSNLSIDFNKKLTVLNLGGSLAFDKIHPTELFVPFVRNRDCGEECSKTSQQYLVGLTQIIDKDSLVQSNFTFAYNTGYLSDPYKRVAVFDGDLFTALRNDTRPREKFQWAWLTQYVRHFGSLNSAALHADYRLTTDDWGISSHTMELSWHQPIAAGWQVTPRFRYYSQDQADFYQAVLADGATDAFYSSDYRLGGFGTVSGGLKLSKVLSNIKPLQDARFQVGAEFYDRSANLQLSDNYLGRFADFTYYLVTASVYLKF